MYARLLCCPILSVLIDTLVTNNREFDGYVIGHILMLQALIPEHIRKYTHTQKKGVPKLSTHKGSSTENPYKCNVEYIHTGHPGTSWVQLTG